ncbi:MAG: hypothetical protein Q9191_005737 [Dirinaria sp. TL-2023a]
MAMVPHRLLLFQLKALRRPLRPPNQSTQPPQPRPFTQNTQLLLISPHAPRPQLPFLHSTSSGLAAQPGYRGQSRTQLARYLTTERRQKLVYEVKLGVKWVIYVWIASGLIAVVYFGFQQEYFERSYPTPAEWSFMTRVAFRRACAKEDPDPTGEEVVDTVNTGATFRGVVERLEDSSIDGAGLLPVLKDEGDIYVEGLGRTGFDITSKSEPWRRGYFEAIMGAARGAEANEGTVVDKTRDLAFPREMVVGPSNPRPKPIPHGLVAAPLEENCVPVFAAPETFYMKILTTQGFNTRQRLEAALAYADWLDYKGLHSTAEDMCDWGLDIAMGALPEGVNNVVDTRTGVINAHPEYISSNILTATTALATHHARNNNLATALPIFLSVLRARRQLPLSPSLTSPPPPSQKSDNENTSNLFSSLKSLLSAPPFPSAPLTGDERPLRTPASICEEAGLMMHIGEVLFASSSTVSPSEQNTPRASGLGWTRDAVELAETTLSTLNSVKPGSEKESTEARKKCSQCVETGTENWRLMVQTMLREEKRRKAGSPVEVAKKKAKTSWLLGGNHQSTENDEGEGRWERELAMVESKLTGLREAAWKEQENAQQSAKKILWDIFISNRSFSFLGLRIPGTGGH